MSFKTHVSKNYNKIARMLKINGNTHAMIDPQNFMLDLFTFSAKNGSYFPTDHWELVIIILVGGMGGGKTETIKNIANYLFMIYQNELQSFQTNDLVYSLKTLNQDIESRKKVVMVVFDDALAEGMDSRRSMSNENISMSQNLSVVRHLLANEDENKVPDPRVKNGFCVMVYSIQSPTRLDKFIRENAHLTIYKSYYENLESEKGVSPDAVNFIKDVTEDSMYKHTYAARGSALGITKTKKTMQMYFSKVDIQIPVLVPPAERYQELLNAILEFDLEEVDPNILKGFIDLWCDDHSISLAQTDVVKIINRAKFYQYKGICKLENENKQQSKKEELQQQLIEQIIQYRNEKISWRKISRLLGINHPIPYDMYNRYITQEAKKARQTI